MIEFGTGTARVRAAMVMANAAALRAALLPRLEGDTLEVDLGAVTELDSSALSVMMGWRREGAARHCAVRYTRVPANLRTLADLYGVADLLL